jgi:hypothetical protein
MKKFINLQIQSLLNNKGEEKCLHLLLYKLLKFLACATLSPLTEMIAQAESGCAI